MDFIENNMRHISVNINPYHGIVVKFISYINHFQPYQKACYVQNVAFSNYFSLVNVNYYFKMFFREAVSLRVSHFWRDKF